MKHILILGAGQSAPYLIAFLLEHARQHDWFVTVADLDERLAAARVGDSPRGAAIAIDASDHDMMSAQIQKADVVVNLLSPVFQHQIAWECVLHGKHMISASYRDRQVRQLHRDAQRKGVLILCEVGLDPGIDHMSAMRVIHDIHNRGGVIERFYSYGSGVPAPDSIDNPLKYVVTWNPRNVVMSAEHGAQYLIDGKIKIVPHSHVFQRSWPVNVDGIGPMEAYPNRDSLSYKELYGLPHADTMMRGTLRYPGWSETWHQIVRLGLPNENMRIPALKNRTWAELVEMFIPRDVAGVDLPQRVASHLNISPTGHIMQNMRWLGLFDEAPTAVEGETAADAMIHLLRKKLALKEGGRDMVVIVHEVHVRYPDENDRFEKVTSTMVEYGQPSGFTAMAKTVGLPAAIAVKLLLTGDLPMTGSHIPTHPAIYTPILAELEATGIRITEKTSPAEE
jgi:saccharopine dehydrogenase-like NADP-dependent oxidoreductase